MTDLATAPRPNLALETGNRSVNHSHHRLLIGLPRNTGECGIFHAGMLPNLKETPRNRKRPKRGRKRLCNAAIHALRMHGERTCAWEEKCKRLLLRFERIQHRHYGMKLMAYTLLNLRAFCGT
jgi:hypothetical protein